MTSTQTGILLVLAGCFTSSSSSPASPPEAPPRKQASERSSEPPDGSTLRTFTEGVVHAFKRCVATAPDELVIEIQTDATPTRAVFAMAIDLFHGPRDRVPRQFTVGGASTNRCDPGCTGTVWLDVIEPGKRVRGRFDLQWDGYFARQRFEVAWRNGVWDVVACPYGPDAHP